jgi:hypothetical protein
VKISALVVAGVYLFRRFTEDVPERVTHPQNQVAPLGRFILAFSILYLSLSIAVGPAPTLAAAMAILIMVAVLLANGISVTQDLREGLGTAKPKTAARGRRGGSRGGSRLQPTTPAPHEQETLA